MKNAWVKNINIIIISIIIILIFSSVRVLANDRIKRKIEVSYNNIKIAVNNQIIDLGYDSKGEYIEPFIYNGTTYLPVRAISEAIGEDVYWDDRSKTVFIGEYDYSNIVHKKFYLPDNYNTALTAEQLFNNFEIDKEKTYKYYYYKNNINVVKGYLKSIDVLEDIYNPGTFFYTLVLDAKEDREIFCHVYIDVYNEGVEGFSNENIMNFGDMKSLKKGDFIQVRALDPVYSSDLKRISLYNTYLDE